MFPQLSSGDILSCPQPGTRGLSIVSLPDRERWPEKRVRNVLEPLTEAVDSPCRSNMPRRDTPDSHVPKHGPILQRLLGYLR